MNARNGFVCRNLVLHCSRLPKASTVLLSAAHRMERIERIGKKERERTANTESSSQYNEPHSTFCMPIYILFADLQHGLCAVVRCTMRCKKIIVLWNGSGFEVQSS